MNERLPRSSRPSSTPSKRAASHAGRLFAVAAAALAAALGASRLSDGGFFDSLLAPADAVAAEEAAAGERILAAARAFLDGLEPEAKAKALFDLDDTERFNWHFIPRERKGLPLTEMDLARQQKALDLLKASLSVRGYRRAEEVRVLEGILRDMEGPGRRFSRDPKLYFVSFFGEPTAEGSWAWRWEGHHLSLNFTLDGARVVAVTPSMYGSNPARVQSGPRTGLRVLADVEDLARELVTSLDETQRARCLGEDGGVPKEVPDTEKAKYTGPFPAGIEARELTRDQRRILTRLLRAYRSNFPRDCAERILERQRAKGLANVRFAWGGAIEPSRPHSYLIHGPTFVINYSNVQNGGNHVHSAFRELDRDFGVD